MLKRLRHFLQRHYGLTFVLMGITFFLFGLLSLNLIYLFKSNIDLFLQYGTMVIADGALRQLFELIGYGYLSLAFYVMFKACEHILVDGLLAAAD
jgi:hypothetical protein